MGLFGRLRRKPAATAPSGSARLAAIRDAPPAPPPATPGPAPSPAPAAAPAPATDALLRELADKISGLAKNVESERETLRSFEDKVRGMEDRVKALHGLSELLSIKYNPFLGDNEEEAFAGKLGPLEDLLAPPVGSNGDGAAPRTPEPQPPVVASTDGPSGGVAGVAAPPGTFSNHPDGAHPVGTAFGLLEAPAPAPPSTVPDFALDHATPDPPAPARRPQALQPPPPHGEAFAPLYAWATARSGGTREAYLVLGWFEALVAQVGPAGLHRLLEYYHTIGWIPDDAKDWMSRVAQGVAPRRPTPPGREAPLADPRKMLRVHKASLRVLDHLFRRDLFPAETRQLDRAVRALWDTR